MSTYTSQGTISFDWDHVNDTDQVAILFIPDSDHSIKRESKTVAVFAPQSKCDDKAILRAYDTDKGVKVKLFTTKSAKCHALMKIVSYAATRQTTVRIRVEPRSEEQGSTAEIVTASDRLVKAIASSDGDKMKSAEEAVKKIIQAGKMSTGEQCLESLELVGITVPGRPAK